MVNRVIYSGRIANELNLKKSKNDKSFIFFNLAIQRHYDKDKVDFINCVAWNKLAENLVKYQNKGNLIIVEGSTESYKKNEVNMTRCLVENITFLEEKRDSNNKNEEEEAISPLDDSSAENEDTMINTEDLPY